MKILHVTTHLNIGGIANYVVSLTKALKAKGAISFVASSGGDLVGELEKNGTCHRRLDILTKSELSLKVLKSIFALVRIVRQERIDVIHAHTRVSQVAAFFASRITGVPYVTTCHGYFKVRLRKVFDTWGDKVIAISEAVAAHLEDDLGVKSQRVAVIYSGVDADRFSKDYSSGEIQSLKDSLGLGPGPVIGTIGRLSPVKGHAFLIQSMAEIVSRLSEAQCLIVGDGPEYNLLKNLAGSLGIEDSVRFVSSNPDTHKFLSVMDVFVFPSVKEGLGIALLEALASGRPCVASDVGGISNIIKNGHNGILVPARDPGSIAGAAIGLINDRARARLLGQRARETVKETFTLDGMADKVLHLYEEVIKGRERARDE